MLGSGVPTTRSTGTVCVGSHRSARRNDGSLRHMEVSLHLHRTVGEVGMFCFSRKHCVLLPISKVEFKMALKFFPFRTVQTETELWQRSGFAKNWQRLLRSARGSHQKHPSNRPTLKRSLGQVSRNEVCDMSLPPRSPIPARSSFPFQESVETKKEKHQQPSDPFSLLRPFSSGALTERRQGLHALICEFMTLVHSSGDLLNEYGHQHRRPCQVTN